MFLLVEELLLLRFGSRLVTPCLLHIMARTQSSLIPFLRLLFAPPPLSSNRRGVELCLPHYHTLSLSAFLLLADPHTTTAATAITTRSRNSLVRF